jgi:hypothetical protein
VKEHFKEKDGEFLLSMAATLVVIAEAIRSPDSGADGKVRARRVIEEVMAAGRAEMFAQADILETMLASGAETPRLLRMCDDLVRCVGAAAVVTIIQKQLGAIPRGDSA